MQLKRAFELGHVVMVVEFDIKKLESWDYQGDGADIRVWSSCTRVVASCASGN